ncbi:putative S-adenosylmethionine-dependent methyltransferase-like [Capsicum annuum]|nr:putative S-adenosylmethionine-dependent methyltransferase-like [Capsicum annuum]KAF3650495.1 putative S-adenosylmethionine-dependent methyltransferase-like [Capsicum annuum]
MLMLHNLKKTWKCCGMMVIISPQSSECLVKFFGSSLMDLVSEGYLDESLVDSFNVPTYFPSPKDMTKVVEKNNCFSIERIELTYPKSRLVEEADAKKLMINLRVVLEVLFVNHFGSEIAEEAFTRTILKSDEISTWMKTNYQKAFPDRYLLDNIKPKNDESFGDYAFRWRKEAAKVQPPMSEEEMVPPPANQNQYNPPRINLEKKPPRKFTSLAESRTQLFRRLIKAGYLQPILTKPTNLNSRFFHADQNCSYHSGASGHSTKDCINLKHKIQDLIDQKVIILQSPTPNVNSNPLPNHGGPTVNVIEIEGEWASSKAITKVNLEGLKRTEEMENIEKVVATLSKDLEGIIEPFMVPEKALKQGIEYQPIKEYEIKDIQKRVYLGPCRSCTSHFPYM